MGTVCAMSHNNISKLGIVHHRSEEAGKVRGESINHRLGGCCICWSMSPESAMIFNNPSKYKVESTIKYRELASVSLLHSYEEVSKRGQGE